jgi:hypothetical protein
MIRPVLVRTLLHQEIAIAVAAHQVIQRRLQGFAQLDRQQRVACGLDVPPTGD